MGIRNILTFQNIIGIFTRGFKVKSGGLHFDKIEIFISTGHFLSGKEHMPSVQKYAVFEYL